MCLYMFVVFTGSIFKVIETKLCWKARLIAYRIVLCGPSVRDKTVFSHNKKKKDEKILHLPLSATYLGSDHGSNMLSRIV